MESDAPVCNTTEKRFMAATRGGSLDIGSHPVKTASLDQSTGTELKKTGKENKFILASGAKPKSKIPVPVKKIKTPPDFRRIHQNWQTTFHKGKAVAKKACTRPCPFNLTQQGSKFIVVREKDLEFPSSKDGPKESRCTLLNSNTERTRTVKTPLEVHCLPVSVPNTKSIKPPHSALDVVQSVADAGHSNPGLTNPVSSQQEKVSTMPVKGSINFTPDSSALASILSNTGVTHVGLNFGKHSLAEKPRQADYPRMAGRETMNLQCPNSVATVNHYRVSCFSRIGVKAEPVAAGDRFIHHINILNQQDGEDSSKTSALGLSRVTAAPCVQKESVAQKTTTLNLPSEIGKSLGEPPPAMDTVNKLQFPKPRDCGTVGQDTSNHKEGRETTGTSDCRNGQIVVYRAEHAETQKNCTSCSDQQKERIPEKETVVAVKQMPSTSDVHSTCDEGRSIVEFVPDRKALQSILSSEGITSTNLRTTSGKLSLARRVPLSQNPFQRSSSFMASRPARCTSWGVASTASRVSCISRLAGNSYEPSPARVLQSNVQAEQEGRRGSVFSGARRVPDTRPLSMRSQNSRHQISRFLKTPQNLEEPRKYLGSLTQQTQPLSRLRVKWADCSSPESLTKNEKKLSEEDNDISHVENVAVCLFKDELEKQPSDSAKKSEIPNLRELNGPLKRIEVLAQLLQKEMQAITQGEFNYKMDAADTPALNKLHQILTSVPDQLHTSTPLSVQTYGEKPHVTHLSKNPSEVLPLTDRANCKPDDLGHMQLKQTSSLFKVPLPLDKSSVEPTTQKTNIEAHHCPLSGFVNASTSSSVALPVSCCNTDYGKDSACMLSFRKSNCINAWQKPPVSSCSLPVGHTGGSMPPPIQSKTVKQRHLHHKTTMWRVQMEGLLDEECAFYMRETVCLSPSKRRSLDRNYQNPVAKTLYWQEAMQFIPIEWP